MTTKPDISVILPVYNVEEYLEVCLDSILAQTAVSIEIIAVNDASTDNSLKLLEDYQQANDQLKIISLQTNRGAGHARNIALAEAMGEYAIFIDSDDYLLADTLSELLVLAQSHETDIVIFGYQIDQENKKTTTPMFPTDRAKWDTALTNEAISSLNDSPQFITINNYPWNKLYRTDFLKQQSITFSETIVNNDIFAHWVSLMKSEKIYLYDKPCYVHRLFNSRAQITSYFDERRFDLFRAIEDVETFFYNNPVYKKRFYHYFLILKHDVFLWARGKMPDHLVNPYNQKATQSIKRMSLLDVLKNFKQNPSVYICLMKIKLGIHPQFKVMTRSH